MPADPTSDDDKKDQASAPAAAPSAPPVTTSADAAVSDAKEKETAEHESAALKGKPTANFLWPESVENLRKLFPKLETKKSELGDLYSQTFTVRQGEKSASYELQIFKNRVYMKGLDALQGDNLTAAFDHLIDAFIVAQKKPETKMGPGGPVFKAPDPKGLRVTVEPSKDLSFEVFTDLKKRCEERGLTVIEKIAEETAQKHVDMKARVRQTAPTPDAGSDLAGSGSGADAGSNDSESEAPSMTVVPNPNSGPR